MSPQPVLLFPDAELWTTGHLRAALASHADAGRTYAAGVYVDRVVPAERRPRMVIVRRDGGLTTRLFDNPRVSFRVYAETEKDANDLARLVVGVMQAAAGHGPVVLSTVESGPTSLPDESRQQLRYAVLSLRTRGVQL